MILDAEVAHTKGEALKASTKKNLLCQLNSYQKFCDLFLLPYFPVDNIQICRYGQFLSRNEKEMKMFSQGLRRIMEHEVKQAAPITPELLIKMSKVVNYISQVDMVAWVCTLIGFTMFLRKSNLVPDSMNTFNPSMQFRRQDFHLTDLLSPMMAEITWAKNLQFKQKILRLPVLPVENKAICPVMWLHYMVNKIPAEPHDPAFTIWVDGQKMALSANQLINRIRNWLKLMKENEEEYSLHSLRRGSATFAYQCNIEGEMMKRLGNWASDTYK